jgi:hypothetical protein
VGVVPSNQVRRREGAHDGEVGNRVADSLVAGGPAVGNQVVEYQVVGVPGGGPEVALREVEPQEVVRQEVCCQGVFLHQVIGMAGRHRLEDAVRADDCRVESQPKVVGSVRNHGPPRRQVV